MNNEERTAMMRKAMALYFDFDEDEIGNFIFGCERQTSDGAVMFSSGWSAVPHWILNGFIDELRATIERKRAEAQVEHASAIEEILKGNHG